MGLAILAIESYNAALAGGAYEDAWNMLASDAMDRLAVPFDQWSAEKTAFFESVAGRWKITVWPPDLDPINRHIQKLPSGIDLRHAVLIEVTYPAITQEPGTVGNLPFDIYIVVIVAGRSLIYPGR